MLGTQPIPQEGGARADSSALARGRAALRARNFEQAEKAFSEAYRQNPSSVEAMLGMAAVSHMQGKEKLARDWMSSAVAMAPGQPAVLQAQARLLVEQGLPAAAEESYKAAIGSRPDEVQLSLIWRPCMPSPSRSPDRRSACYVMCGSAPIWSMPSYQLGVALSLDGRVDEAGRVLDDALRRSPEMRVYCTPVPLCCSSRGSLTELSNCWTRPWPSARICPCDDGAG
jgi:tetratricopeptide (TPR) repeat protein